VAADSPILELSALERAVLRLLSVPSAPEVPQGSAASVRIFRAGDKFYAWLVFEWAFVSAVLLLGMLSASVPLVLAARTAPDWGRLLLLALLIVVWTAFGIGLIVTFLARRIDVRMRWYIVTDRSLRIRAGLWQVREITMTFANIQHIAVHQGPFQRLLGIYDLEVSSAGGGASMPAVHKGAGGDTHRGFFHGIVNAPEVRDMMLERLRHLRDAGLGDPDEHHPIQTGESRLESSVAGAARELLDAAKALRRIFA